MGNSDTKLNFRKAVIQLTTKTQPVEPGDEAFWSQFWSETTSSVQDVFTLIPAAEIRALREESPSNLATLCYKAVEKLVQAADSGCGSVREQQTVLNCVRMLTRILPYIFEDPDWRGFFWSTLPGQIADEETENVPLAQSLMNALSDLLFCPDFSVGSSKKQGPETAEDMHTIDSCEYIWEAGVGFAHSPPNNTNYDSNRNEILKLILTCFSETMYLPPVADAHSQPNQWIRTFTSTENRHALPLFTSLLNTVFAYDPVGYGVPYNHLMFADSREPLVEACLQVLCVAMDNENHGSSHEEPPSSPISMEHQPDVGGPDNLFVNYMSRIHREEDFAFILKGFTRLLNNPLIQTYLPGSCKKVQCHQELLVLFWCLCDINKKFMFYVLKSSDVLDILVPILFHLNDARADQSRVGLMHIGVFILLLLSGERNFGVRLNKPYTVRVPMDIPVFTGTHADLLIVVFHKIITTGHQRLQPLFDCLLTIIVNISPYLKTLSMVASTKLLHLLEAFSTPWFLYSSPNNHHLVFFLLEVFNNIIQYQFDGNANLVYTIIRKRTVFHQLANLPTDHSSISKALTKRSRGKVTKEVGGPEGTEQSMEGSRPAMEAEPGTLSTTLAATPVLPNTVKTVEEAGPGVPYKETGDFFVHDYDPSQPPPLEAEQYYGNVVVPEDASLIRSFLGTQTLLEGAFTKRTMSTAPASAGYRHLLDMDALSVPATKPKPVLKTSRSLPDLIAESKLYKDETKPLKPKPKPKPKLIDFAQKSVEISTDSPVKLRLAAMLGIEKMTEKSPASTAHSEQQTVPPLATQSATMSIQPGQERGAEAPLALADPTLGSSRKDNVPDGEPDDAEDKVMPTTSKSVGTPPNSPGSSVAGSDITQPTLAGARPPMRKAGSIISTASSGSWVATPEWVQSWKHKLPLQTIMRLLQVLVPQVEKICIDKGLTDESEILKFLQHGTLVGLLPVPHPILIRKYQANSGTTMWFRTYMWGVIYLRNVDPPVWYDTDVKLFEIQRV